MTNMDFGINSLFKRLGASYAASPFGQFMSWWGRELSGLLPVAVRTWFAESRDDLLLSFDGDQVVLARAHPRLGEAPKTFARADGAVELKSALTQAMAKMEEQPRVLFTINAKRVMNRSLNLPLAAQDNLKQVVGFEMDRQTPFRADQTYFDFKINKRDVAAKQLKVEFAATPKASLDAELGWFQTAGIGLDGVDGVVIQAESGLPRRMGFNLLDPSKRTERGNSRVRLNWILAAIGLVLLGLVMMQSLQNREQALLDMQTKVDKVELEARKVRKLRKDLNDAVNGANFLAEKRHTIPRLIELVQDLTKRLPEDTFVQSITINQGKVRVSGQAKDANSLIVVLQKSTILAQPTIEGQVSTDPRTSKEVFAISAQFKTVLAAEEKAKAAEAAKEKAKNSRNSSGADDATSA